MIVVLDIRNFLCYTCPCSFLPLIWGVFAVVVRIAFAWTPMSRSRPWKEREIRVCACGGYCVGQEVAKAEASRSRSCPVWPRQPYVRAATSCSSRTSFRATWYCGRSWVVMFRVLIFFTFQSSVFDVLFIWVIFLFLLTLAVIFRVLFVFFSWVHFVAAIWSFFKVFSCLLELVAASFAFELCLSLSVFQCVSFSLSVADALCLFECLFLFFILLSVVFFLLLCLAVSFDLSF